MVKNPSSLVAVPITKVLSVSVFKRTLANGIGDFVEKSVIFPETVMFFCAEIFVKKKERDYKSKYAIFVGNS